MNYNKETIGVQKSLMPIRANSGVTNKAQGGIQALVTKLTISLNLILMTGLMMAVESTHAQTRNPDRRINELERAIERLQDRNERLDRRVTEIERFLDGGYNPKPPKDLQHFCMIVDSNTKRVFLSQSNSRIDAEFKAKETCSKTIYSGYCNGSDEQHLRCDTNANSNYAKVVCMISDSNTKRVFRGEGDSYVAAEANAKIACQQGGVYSGYCGLQPANCEEVY